MGACTGALRCIHEQVLPAGCHSTRSARSAQEAIAPTVSPVSPFLHHDQTPSQAGRGVDTNPCKYRAGRRCCCGVSALLQHFPRSLLLAADSNCTPLGGLLLPPKTHSLPVSPSSFSLQTPYIPIPAATVPLFFSPHHFSAILLSNFRGCHLLTD